MKIATWNVNSIRARIGPLLDWLREAQPDIALLQEIKTTEDQLPRLEIEDLGYQLVAHGQRSYNGVAILSKRPLHDVTVGLPDFVDDQARYVEAVVPTDSGIVRVASLYTPNGNPADSEKFDYKLRWLAALRMRAETLLAFEEPLVLGGDYNVIPTPQDVYDPVAWADDALFRIETRTAFRGLVNLGLTDAVRACHGAPQLYTFWDYQAGAWQRNKGLRIDHLLLSPQAADLLESCDIDRHVRGRERPSDHVPVWCTLRA
jgi:exodeoxyribonuclease-3